MKRLEHILNQQSILQYSGSLDIDINQIQSDSRKIQNGDLFVAVNGVSSNGHDYISKAVLNGAIAVVCEQFPAKLEEHVTWIQLEDTQESLGHLASNFYDNPSRHMSMIGVTGTNGKSSIVNMLFDLTKSMGLQVGLISTISNKIGNVETPSKFTTPDAVGLQALLSEMKMAKCELVFMEVSSHALHQKRVSGIDFNVAVFTNLTHDHLDYHDSFKEYLNTKKSLFDHLKKDAYAITNIDDKNGKVMIQNSNAILKTYALHRLADYHIKLLDNSSQGLHLTINQKELYLKLTGKFNAYNSAAVIAVADILGLHEEETLKHLSLMEPVKGRMEKITAGSNSIIAYVDYAHTPDALLNVLETIQSFKKPNQRTICVVGCGGDRDKLKRPKMAHIASMLSDTVILTSDNPRTEDPQAIIKDMEAGVGEDKHNVLSVLDRKQAIKTACALANDMDIILIAGKGHENYQEINGEKLPFDDTEIVKEILQKTN